MSEQKHPVHGCPGCRDLQSALTAAQKKIDETDEAIIAEWKRQGFPSPPRRDSVLLPALFEAFAHVVGSALTAAQRERDEFVRIVGVLDDIVASRASDRDAARADAEALRVVLRTVKEIAEGHHGQQPGHELLHALIVEIPDYIDQALSTPSPASRDEPAGEVERLREAGRALLDIVIADANTPGNEQAIRDGERLFEQQNGGSRE